jgi:hypothetical protein
MLLAYLLRTSLVGPIPYILFSILFRSNSCRSAQFAQPDSATEGGAAAVQSALGRLMFPQPCILGMDEKLQCRELEERLSRCHALQREFTHAVSAKNLRTSRRD